MRSSVPAKPLGGGSLIRHVAQRKPRHRWACLLPRQHQPLFACDALHESTYKESGRCRHQSGLLRFSVNEANMTLKLILIRSFSLVFASTECRSHDGKTSSVPSFTLTTT